MRTLCLAAALGLVSAPALAQDDPAPAPSRARVVAPRPLGVYAGVEAGEAQPPPAYGRVVRRQRRRRGRLRQILTWPGFAPLGDGGSRFFVQTNEPIQPEVRTENRRVVVVFPNTSIHLTNSRRWLETRFFNTPVLRARLERRRRDMALVLLLRADFTVQPRVTTEVAPGGNFHYVYIDFPPGDYAPVISTVPGTSTVRAADTPEHPPAAPARRIDPTLDDERPPGMR